MGRTYEETGLVRAHAKWVRTSARKARVVLEHVRGLPVADARVQLRFATRHAADDILRVLESAIANAVNNHGLEEESLVVAEAFADEGVTMKRWQPRARGRAMRIRKRTAHITILLRSVDEVEAPKAPKKAAAAKAAAVEEPKAEKPKRSRAKKAAAETPVVEAEATTAEAEVVEAEAPDAEATEALAAAETVATETEAPEADAPEAEVAEKPKPKAKAKPRAKKPAAEPKADADVDPEGEEA
jgi:large subunit ribosomal protein L22